MNAKHTDTVLCQVYVNCESVIGGAVSPAGAVLTWRPELGAPTR